MEGDSSKQKNIKAKSSNMDHDAGTILQSVWIRHSTVLANGDDWQSMGRQLRFVLCSGTIFWIIYAISLYL